MQSNTCRSKVTYKRVHTGYSSNMRSHLEDNGVFNENENDASVIKEYSIAFLGSSKVGKTSILQQLVHQQHEEKYEPTSSCQKYYKAAYMDGRLYDTTLRDCPGVSCFPQDTVREWTDYKGYGLHLCQVGLRCW